MSLFSLLTSITLIIHFFCFFQDSLYILYTSSSLSYFLLSCSNGLLCRPLLPTHPIRAHVFTILHPPHPRLLSSLALSKVFNDHDHNHDTRIILKTKFTAPATVHSFVWTLPISKCVTLSVKDERPIFLSC